MSKTKRLSIITVTYNSVKTLEKAILSVISQTYTNLEYIIIDGKSTDGTLDIIDTYRDRIDYYVSESDTGIYDAMNKGIRASTGDVIYFLGSDDEIIHPNTMRDMMEEFCKKDIDMLYGNVLHISKKGHYTRAGREIYLRDIQAGRRPSHQSMLMSKESLVSAGLFNTTYQVAADFDLMCTCFKQNLPMSYTNTNVAIYGISGKSSTQKNENYAESADIIQKHFGSIRMWIFIIKKKVRSLFI